MAEHKPTPRFSSNQSAKPRPLGVRPLILVHGWGNIQTDFKDYVALLKKDGFPSDRIFVVHYDSMASMNDIERTVSSQMKSFIDTFEQDQQFDVIGHSMGHFVGLYSLMKSGLNKRVKKYIGLAGIAHGLDDFLPCRGILFRAAKKNCGGIRSLMPSNNKFLNDFYRTYHDQITALDKCSLSSPDDVVISSSPTSGFFNDGTNVPLTGMRQRNPVLNWKTDIHFRIKSDPQFFKLMKDRCYGKGGAEKAWSSSSLRIDIKKLARSLGNEGIHE